MITQLILPWIPVMARWSWLLLVFATIYGAVRLAGWGVAALRQRHGQPTIYRPLTSRAPLPLGTNAKLGDWTR